MKNVMGACCKLAAVLLVAGWVSPAMAATARKPTSTKAEICEQHGDQGDVFLRKKQYKQALAEYQEAYEMCGQPAMICAAGGVYYAWGKPGDAKKLNEAMGKFERCMQVEEGLDPTAQDSEMMRDAHGHMTEIKILLKEIDENPPWYKKFWVWAGIIAGVAAVGGVAAAIVVCVRGDCSSKNSMGSMSSGLTIPLVTNPTPAVPLISPVGKMNGLVIFSRTF